MAKLLKKGVPTLLALATSVLVLISVFSPAYGFDVSMRGFLPVLFNIVKWFSVLYAAIVILRGLKNATSNADNSNKVIKSSIFLSVLYVVLMIIRESLFNPGIPFKMIFRIIRRPLLILLVNVVWALVYSAMSRRFPQEEEE